MSLLLKALKQAEKSGAATADPTDLDLEPLTLATPKPRPQWAEPGEPRGAADSRLGLALPRLGLVPATALIALLVALAYGVYVYRALHPTGFAAATPPVRTAPPASAPPAAQPASSAPTAPAPQAMRATVAVSVPTLASPAPAARHKPAARRAPAHTRARDQRPAATTAVHATAAVTANPSALDAAYAAWQGGRLDEAQALYKRAAAEHGGADAWLGLASIASLRGQTGQAAEYYEKVLQLDPNNAVAQVALLDSLGSSDSAAAEAHLQNLIHQRPSAFLYYALGNFYAGQKRWANAESAYFEASRRAPENADFAYNLAVSLDHLQQYPAAIRYYREALQLAGPDTRFDPQAAKSRIAQLAGQ